MDTHMQGQILNRWKQLYQPDLSQDEYTSGKDTYRVMSINNKS